MVVPDYIACNWVTEGTANLRFTNKKSFEKFMKTNEDAQDSHSVKTTTSKTIVLEYIMKPKDILKQTLIDRVGEDVTSIVNFEQQYLESIQEMDYWLVRAESQDEVMINNKPVDCLKKFGQPIGLSLRQYSYWIYLCYNVFPDYFYFSWIEKFPFLTELDSLERYRRVCEQFPQVKKFVKMNLFNVDIGFVFLQHRSMYEEQFKNETLTFEERDDLQDLMNIVYRKLCVQRYWTYLCFFIVCRGVPVTPTIKAYFKSFGYSFEEIYQDIVGNKAHDSIAKEVAQLKKETDELQNRFLNGHSNPMLKVIDDNYGPNYDDSSNLTNSTRSEIRFNSDSCSDLDTSLGMDTNILDLSDETEDKSPKICGMFAEIADLGGHVCVDKHAMVEMENKFTTGLQECENGYVEGQIESIDENKVKKEVHTTQLGRPNSVQTEEVSEESVITVNADSPIELLDNFIDLYNQPTAKEEDFEILSTCSGNKENLLKTYNKNNSDLIKAKSFKVFKESLSISRSDMDEEKDRTTFLKASKNDKETEENLARKVKIQLDKHSTIESEYVETPKESGSDSPSVQNEKKELEAGKAISNLPIDETNIDKEENDKNEAENPMEKKCVNEFKESNSNDEEIRQSKSLSSDIDEHIIETEAGFFLDNRPIRNCIEYLAEKKRWKKLKRKGNNFRDASMYDFSSAKHLIDEGEKFNFTRHKKVDHGPMATANEHVLISSKRVLDYDHLLKYKSDNACKKSKVSNKSGNTEHEESKSLCTSSSVSCKEGEMPRLIQPNESSQIRRYASSVIFFVPNYVVKPVFSFISSIINRILNLARWFYVPKEESKKLASRMESKVRGLEMKYFQFFSRISEKDFNFSPNFDDKYLFKFQVKNSSVRGFTEYYKINLTAEEEEESDYYEDDVDENSCDAEVSFINSLVNTRIVFDDEGNPIEEPIQNDESSELAENEDKESYLEYFDQIELPEFKKARRKCVALDYNYNQPNDECNEPPEGFPKHLLKYWIQRHRLFLKFDHGIQLDDESWFSVTPEMIAAHHAMRCKVKFIMDAFCGAGGTAIQLAMTCDKVIAFDIDGEKLKMARHNAKIYGVEDKIEFIKGDYFKLGVNYKNVDAVLLSPPWGGVQYSVNATYDVMKLNGMMNARELMAYTRKITKNIALFLPRNSNYQQIISLAEENSTVDIETNHYGYKLKALTAYYGELATYEG